MATSTEIRKQFLDFFAAKGHTIVPSAPIVIKNDPTLLFTNAGMNQFKDYFLGNKSAPYKRATDTQKCLRVSGKHNDLEEVGVDTYHHTMFEMLGNWSFGDYFKKEAIAWSWELLTKVYQLDPNKLYATVFEGDEKENIPFDQEAYDAWSEWLPKDHILKGNKHDNFWEMGDTGPCGPCSEIHFDNRSEAEIAKVSGASLVNQDDPQVIEIWNNVFMQYNRQHDGSLQPLPAKHVDTGMGFERLVRIIQGKTSNYDTDVFTGTIALIEKITGKKYTNDDSKMSIAFRVLSDHIRAIAFAISDGQLPSNTGAGYVIRRILRRAVRYYYSYLDYKKPLLFQLLETIANQFAEVFPELKKQQDFVTKVIKEEEDAFLRTLDKGLKKMDDILAESKNKTIDGKQAFELYDTFGFPLDLTNLIAQENGFAVDEKGFDQEMAQQKERSRAATAVDRGDWTEVHPTDQITFVGYTENEATTSVVKYRQVKAKDKSFYQIVLAATPFYAEMGGQVGDTGLLIFGEEKIPVFDTKRENDLVIHFTKKLPTNIDAPVIAQINTERRTAIRANHSATHLLHAALRKVLGDHVAQKGSLVNDEILRFDFSHFAKVTDEELQQAQAIVNEKIRENFTVETKELPKEEAMKLGAMHLFGEKYGDIVRVVTMDPQFSLEFCGGTHVFSTGNIGLFIIKSESAVAAGVRRIEALTGKAALEFISEKVESDKQIMDLLKTKTTFKSVEKLLADKSTLEKKIEKLEAQALAQTAKNLVAKAENINGIQFIHSLVDVENGDALKKLAFSIKNAADNTMSVLCANVHGKASVAICIAENLVDEKGLDAGKLIKDVVSPMIHGGGGGQKSLATAGGKDASNLDKVADAIKATL